MNARRLFVPALTLLLAACGSAPRIDTPVAPPPAPVASGEKPAAKAPVARPGLRPAPQYTLKRGGGFYKDDGPAEEIPDNLDDIPDAEPRLEPLHKPATRPYSVLGKEYRPNSEIRPHRQQGIASWYGRKFHGQKTSIGEPYDMFAMTAAHPTLALPSYVRVTHAESGKSVIVRLTDRGPFHADRVIDLSYAAAWKLGLIGNGSGEVIVEAILPEQYASLRRSGTSLPAATPSPDRLQTLLTEVAREETVVPPPPPASGNVFLQLGAFGNAENAENLRRRLGIELDWLSRLLRIDVAGNWHRLRAGPYASRAAAEQAAEQIRLSLGYRPSIVIR